MSQTKTICWWNFYKEHKSQWYNANMQFIERYHTLRIQRRPNLLPLKSIAPSITPFLCQSSSYTTSSLSNIHNHNSKYWIPHPENRYRNKQIQIIKTHEEQSHPYSTVCIPLSKRVQDGCPSEGKANPEGNKGTIFHYTKTLMCLVVTWCQVCTQIQAWEMEPRNPSIINNTIISCEGREGRWKEFFLGCGSSCSCWPKWTQNELK